MIFGIGTDIVNVTRLEKSDEFLSRFIKRSLSKPEQQAMQDRGLATLQSKALYLAKRFAAKEAVVKAIGTGFKDGIYLSDIEVFNDDNGRPTVVLSGNAEKYLIKACGDSFKVHLSLSDDYPFASALVVIEQ